MRRHGRLRRPSAAVALFAAGALTLAACGSDSDDTASEASGGSSSQVAAGGPSASFLALKGSSTSVDLDAATAKVLADNKISIAPIEPATVSTSGGVTSVSFPITEGYVGVYPTTEPSYIRGTFSHSGGLMIRAGGKTLELTDFIVNPGTSSLTATVEGKDAAKVLDLDGTNVKVSQDGANTKLDGTIAKLSSTGADALNQFFGVSLFSQGIPLGVVHVVANGTPGPGGAPSAELLDLHGESTSVDLDAATAKVLADNKVSVAPVAPATVSTTGGITSVKFPISEGYVAVYPSTEPSYIRGAFSHTGGLRFSAGGKSITVTDFIVNPGTSTLSATVEGKNVAQILDLDGTNLQVSQDGGNTKLDGTIAKLSQTGADALNKTFDVSLFKAGIPLGMVHVVANGTPAPSAQ